jgi:hypothetical protein
VNFTPEGTEYIIVVNTVKAVRKTAFDQVMFAKSLQEETGTTIDPGRVPVRNIVFSDNFSGFCIYLRQ